MKRDKFRRTVNDQLMGHVEDEGVDDNLYDVAMQKASADNYERSWKARVKEQRGDCWIAIGLYLILASVAFVAI
jgi:hypothetical protein